MYVNTKYLASLRRFTYGTMLGAGVFAALTLIGHAAGSDTLAGLGGREPMRVAVGLAVLLSVGGMAGLLSGRVIVARIASGALVLFALVIAAASPSSATSWFWPSLFTAIALLSIGLSLFLFSIQRVRAGEHVALGAGAFALFALMRTLVGVTGTGVLSSLTWISFPAALCLFMITLALLLLEPRTRIVRLLTSSLLDGDMARWMLPVAILVPSALAGLQMLGYRSGWIDVDLGLTLMMTLLVCISVVVGFSNAARLRALALAEKKEHSLLEDAQALAGVGSWVLERRHACISYSADCGRLFGMRYEQLPVGQAGFLMLVSDADRVRFAAQLEALSAANPVLNTEITVRHTDGNERWISLRARVETDEDGSVVRVFGTLLDLTEWRRNERALAERTQRLSTLLRSIGDAVIATDAAGRVELMNPVAERMTGWTLEESKGRPLGDVFCIINEHTRMPVENPVGRVLREGRVVGLANHTALVRRDGDERSIADSAAPIWNENGTVSGVVMVFHDVTDVRVATEEKERLRGQLVAADRMASLGLLAAGVAHEINNPLSYLSGGLSLLEPSLFDRIYDATMDGRLESVRSLIDEGREMARDCLHGAERIRRIVGDLGAFGRVHDDSPEGANVSQAIELGLRLAGCQIRPRARAEFVPARVPLVKIAQERLGQVLLNLLLNAAHAIPEGEPERNFIRITCRTEPDGKRVAIEIEDSGCGISAEHLSRLFEPFFTTKPVGMGTGLGLSICHGIVTSIGGEITVDSMVDRGTTFRVLLPVAESIITKLKRPARLVGQVRRGRILIIDDDPLVAKIIARLLQPDHDVVVMTQSSAALERLLRGEHFDAVLCDLMMPELTGMDLYKRLDEARPAILERFIFMTGGAVTSAAQEFVNSVVTRCIHKPIDNNILQNLLRELIAKEE